MEGTCTEETACKFDKNSCQDDALSRPSMSECTLLHIQTNEPVPSTSAPIVCVGFSLFPLPPAMLKTCGKSNTCKVINIFKGCRTVCPHHTQSNQKLLTFYQQVINKTKGPVNKEDRSNYYIGPVYFPQHHVENSLRKYILSTCTQVFHIICTRTP